MTSFKIRRAGPEDSEALAHIGVATFVETYTEVIVGSAMVAHCTRQHSRRVYDGFLAADDTACWLAEYTPTDAPVGYAVLCPPDLPLETSSSDLELKRIYVLSRRHGSGIGQALMVAVQDASRDAGARRLLLGTYEGNRRAVAFYRRFGFEQIGVRKFDVGGVVYDDIVMACAL